jgi:hypothetical protein
VGGTEKNAVHGMANKEQEKKGEEKQEKRSKTL